MPPADPLPPVEYALWVPAVAIGLVLLVAAWVAWVLWWTSRRRGQAEARVTARERFLGQVDAAYAGYHDGVLDLRGLHLQLAAALRAYASEEIGTDVRAWTAGRMSEDRRLGPVGTLLARWEQPSFAPRSDAEARAAADAAREVVDRW